MAHIKFNPDLLTISKIVVKKVSQFSGGTALLADDTKVHVPPRYAKAFGDMYYSNGTTAVVVKYEDDILNITHDSSTDFDLAMKSLADFKASIAARDLFFDGVYVYSTELPSNFKAKMNDLTTCKLTVWNPAVVLHKAVELYSVDGMVYNDNGALTVSFPIASLSKYLDIDEIEASHAVSVQGLLNYAHTITTLFGSSHIESLKLPVYMVKYGTVNLIKLPKTIKDTHCTGLTLKMLIANAMGKIKHCTAHRDIKKLRQATTSCLSYNLIAKELACDSKVYTTTEKKTPDLYKK